MDSEVFYRFYSKLFHVLLTVLQYSLITNSNCQAAGGSMCTFEAVLNTSVTQVKVTLVLGPG